MPEVLLAAAPLLLLLVSLLFGRYPGYGTIVRLSERIVARKRLAPVAARRQHRPPPPPCFAPCGGLLIACGLARRPPPVAL